METPLLLSPTHSLLRLLSDGRISPQFLARFFAIPRSTHSIPCTMVVSFSLFSLFFLHGNALYSYLLLIFCFVCSLMVGFNHSFWRVSSPFHDLLAPFCEQWW